MSSSADWESDFRRYVEYLQRSLIGSDVDWAANERAWFEHNKARMLAEMRKRVTADDAFNEVAQQLAAYTPETEYDSFNSRTLFSPFVTLFNGYLKASGLELRSPVIFANAPAAAMSPLSRSTDGAHLLFAGRGLLLFCNYWGKAFADLSLQMAKRHESPYDPTTVASKTISEEPRLTALPLALAVYYAARNTVIGFGKVDEPEGHLGARILLVQAMEAFALGHEFGHFLHAEGRLGEVKDPQTEELACDAIGFGLCVRYGFEQDNVFARLLAGPFFLLWALQTVREVKARLGISHVDSDSHPAESERLAALRRFAAESRNSEQDTTLGEVEQIAAVLSTAIHSGLTSLLSDRAGEGRTGETLWNA